MRVKGIPVYVVGLNTNPSFFPALNCIADESGGQLFAATDEDDLKDVLQSLLDFKRSANFFASPSLPAFAGGFGDTAQIGAVVPSHLNENGDLSSWSVWSGTVKSYQLDSNGLIPVVTAAPATVDPDADERRPDRDARRGHADADARRSLPVLFPDETDPNNVSQAARKPVWSAGRVLGYTNPVPSLAANAVPAAASPAGRAPAISVWPGRKMIFSRAVANVVPDAREDFLPDTGTCGGGHERLLRRP